VPEVSGERAGERPAQYVAVADDTRVTHRPGANWAGNVRFAAARIVRPGSVADLQALVRTSDRLRALGTAHSFSPIADTTGDLVSVADLPQRVEIDADRASVTVSAGMRHGELATRLQAEGLALHNLASLPHISVAGAVATGTHGSGVRNGSLATEVTALEMVTADGELISLSRAVDSGRFLGGVVALGCLGVVTALTLRVEPTYDVAQTVYEDLPFGRVATDLDTILSAAYSVSLFTTWGDDVVDHVWLKRRVDDPAPDLGPTWMDAHRATHEWHPIGRMSPAACTPQLGVPGPWHERLPHFRLDHTPSSGSELQTEYLVPRRYAVLALQAVHELRRLVAPVLQVSEIRTVAADDLWLSPAFGVDCLCIHFTWVADEAAVLPVVAAMESALTPFEPRPHWGKVFTLAPERVQARYPRLEEFRALRRELDPGNRFGNTMVDRYLGD
jgi:alditol oxidase